jgi:hypothetical protein
MSSFFSPRHRRGGAAPIGGVAAVGLIIMIAGAYLGYTFMPVWFDHMAMKEITRTVVLDWANHEQEPQARMRLNAELKRKNVSMDIEEKNCTFHDNKGAWEVDCFWKQYAYYPGTDYYKIFPLRARARFVDGKAETIAD